MTKLLVALTALLITGCAPSVPATFTYACAEVAAYFPDREVSCDTIEPPVVVSTRLATRVGVYGIYYPGEEHIIISPDAPIPADVIIVHETTHYVIHEAGIQISPCEHEEIARIVHSHYQGTEYDPSWKSTYGC